MRRQAARTGGASRSAAAGWRRPGAPRRGPGGGRRRRLPEAYGSDARTIRLSNHLPPDAALKAAAETPPLAVVLDLIMPRLDGFEFLERFRQTEAGQSTPVIVWTVKDLTTHDQARLREKAQAVVLKGSDGAAALVRELDAFLPRRQEAQ